MWQSFQSGVDHARGRWQGLPKVVRAAFVRSCAAYAHRLANVVHPPSEAHLPGVMEAALQADLAEAHTTIHTLRAQAAVHQQQISMVAGQVETYAHLREKHYRRQWDNQGKPTQGDPGSFAEWLAAQ